MRIQLVLWLMLLAFVAGALTERPPTLGNLAWMMVIPMVATRLLGARFGARWLVLSIFAKQAADHSDQLLRQVRAADEAKSVFLASVSHEIRTPLNGILGMTQAEIAVPSLEGRRVLLVDDNAVNLRVAQGLLQRMRCEVVTASSGEEALERVAATTPDLVLMDCYLPGIDGWEATRRLHALPGAASVPVIALTASAARDDVERCLDAGMTGVLAKPILFGDLCRTLSAYAVDGPSAARITATAEAPPRP